jgi:hypothetical protein
MKPQKFPQFILIIIIELCLKINEMQIVNSEISFKTKLDIKGRKLPHQQAHFKNF